MAKKTKERISVRVGKARASYLCLTKPSQYSGKFQGDFLIPKDEAASSGLKELKKAIIAVGKSQIDSDWKMSDNPDKIIKDGDEKYEELKEQGEGKEDSVEAYRGHYFITPKQKMNPDWEKNGRPVVVNFDKTVMTDEEIEGLKSGDYFYVVVSPYKYKAPGKTGIALSFDGLQFAGTGEALGGSGRAAVLEMFEEIEAELDDVEGLDNDKDEDDDDDF